ncbi:alpha-1,2-mannosyltransferase [Astrocystis sublimbata]|nr:alpha-1,2-mannosyltransferase [Astrocystis sublimbata]
MAMILTWPVLAICLPLIILVALKPLKHGFVSQRFRFTGSPTRPSTPELEKQRPSKSLASTTSDLPKTFALTPRDQLKDLARTLQPAQQKALGSLNFHQDVFERSLLGLAENYRDADDSRYICSGLSVREVKALGDFPDHATLSGVPMPNPYPEFDIDTAKPRPYRPLRWPHHQTMAVAKLEPDFWIELESTYKERLAQRHRLYEKHGADVVHWLPGSELACKELMEMVLQFVCARYPQYFVLSDDHFWLENKILEVRANIRAKHPLLVLFDHVPEDFAIMQRDAETGYYVFRAGAICSAIGFNVGTKIGKKLHEIHVPVPDYKEKLQFSMDRFFSKMPTNKPYQRGTWDLELDQPLYRAPGEVPDRTFEENDVARLCYRVDWQTLRRMPLSGAVVFNFKALFTPIEEVRDEPYVPSLILAFLRNGKANIKNYKSVGGVKHIFTPTLEGYEREQKETGLIDKDWEPSTLEEGPFFQGWEKKWHAQQGF